MWTVSSDVKDSLKLGDDKNVQRFLRRAFRFFHKVARPTFIGPLSLDMGLSLRQLHLLISVLLDAGDIRLATHEELTSMNVNDLARTEVYTLSERPQAHLAYD